MIVNLDLGHSRDVIAAAKLAGLTVPQTAYVLATAYHETGGRMLPVRESLNYSVEGLMKTFSRSRISSADALAYGRKTGRAANQQAIANLVYGGEWGRENLGNTEPNDGWTYRGGGLVQVTGRRNFERVGLATGNDLIAEPDMINDPAISAAALVFGSRDGWFTGKKLSDYISGSKADYRNARRVINGMDRADDIAAYARAYEAVLGMSPARALQTILAKPAPYTGKIDGKFGPQSRAALAEFQRRADEVAELIKQMEI